MDMVNSDILKEQLKESAKIQEVQNEFMPLGKTLRAVTDKFKSEKEIIELRGLLLKQAEKGEDIISFDDLREVVPTMVANNTIFTWLTENEIQVTGGVMNTGAYAYTLSW
jgi:hypothetical protein